MEEEVIELNYYKPKRKRQRKQTIQTPDGLQTIKLPRASVVYYGPAQTAQVVYDGPTKKKLLDAIFGEEA